MAIEDYKKRLMKKFKLARKADKLYYLYHLKNTISKNEFSTLLNYWWILTEFPNQHPLWMLKIMFEYADRTKLLEGYEKEFAALPSKIKVYRGVQDIVSINKKMKIRSFSWTTDKEKAKWFSKRWRKDGSGKLYSALISKEDVFMYSNGRGEKEIILNPDKLKQIREVLE